MNPRLVRIAKVVALPVAAVAVVLLAEFLISLGTQSEAPLTWDALVPDDLGMVATERVMSEDPTVSGLWPIERDGAITGVVAVASAAGYRSRVQVAVSVRADGSELADAIMAGGESAYVRRTLESGGSDALSGATLTEQGIQAARERARSAARQYIEEQR
ncbi:MAG TPA: hypothetical protein VJ932_05985 [Alkalispirochaeta sp.]|nr:hypothetical protein [Alkalispirochaeta sp.]